jgi:hypothetical protein
MWDKGQIQSVNFIFGPQEIVRLRIEYFHPENAASNGALRQSERIELQPSRSGIN